VADCHILSAIHFLRDGFHSKRSTHIALNEVCV